MVTNIYERFLVPPIGHLLGTEFSGRAICGPRYYLIFPRVWELLLGALACILVYNLHLKRIAEKIPASILLAKAIVLIGLSALALSFVFFKETMNWPRISALLPTLLTAGLLMLFHLYGNRTLPRMLSWRPLHLVGRSSYSIYLWHWPVLGLIVYANSDFGLWWTDYVIYFTIVSLQTLFSYMFIEQRRYLLRPWHAWLLLLLFSALSLIASKLERSDVLPQEIRTILDTGTYSQRREMGRYQSTNRFVVLWGDSRSQMLVQTAERKANNT